MLPGASRRHDRITANVIRALGDRLRGQRCQPFANATFVKTRGENVRMPDLGVDCGPLDDDAAVAAEPRLLLEVMSPTTRTFDAFERLEEYKALESLDYLLLVDPDLPRVRVYRRDAERAWTTWPAATSVTDAPEPDVSGLVDTLANRVSVSRSASAGSSPTASKADCSQPRPSGRSICPVSIVSVPA
jgi:Uma2 family endonuclease